MANQSIEYRVTRTDLATEFPFVEPYAPDELSDEELGAVIPSGEGNGTDGGYQSSGWMPTRVPTLHGTIIGDSPNQVNDRINAIMAACPVGPLCLLRRRLVDDETGDVLSDVYLSCRVSGRKQGKSDGLLSRTWGVDFRATSPIWWEWDAQATVPLEETGGTTVLTPGGSERTRPVITFTTTHTGRLTLTIPQPVGTGDSSSIVIDCIAVGTYVLDCENRTLPRDGGATDTRGEIAEGGFFSLLPTATSITTALADTLALSSISAQWRRGWSFA